MRDPTPRVVCVRRATKGVVEMSETGLAAFDTTIEKTNQVLRAIEDAYGWPRHRRPQAYAALRTVLHALRDRLTVEESADLAAQLPMLLRGVYVEGWKPSKVPLKMDREEFLERIRREFTYDVEGTTRRLVRVVVQSLRGFITDGEWEDVTSNLPKDLAEVLS
jgi:uncharacterized protein (DUF2267 family)